MIIYLIHSRWRDCTDSEVGGVRWRTESPSGYLHKVIQDQFSMMTSAIFYWHLTLVQFKFEST